MLKIGSAVHTAHGPGTVTDADTVRGRTQYKVAGVGFDVWVDETRLAARSAALGDVDESNSTTLPYDYTPEHPSEMYTDEAVMSPDHDVDLDERMTPTDSVSGEHADLPFEYPGPNPDLFAKASASLHTAAPGSMRHYLQWANQAGLQPGQAEAADLYASTHGLDAGHAGQLMDNFNNQGQRTGSIRHVSHRPAGLSDKYIDLHTAAPNPQDPARQFLEDPVGTIQRTAYRDITTHGLDPRVAEYMDLVAADSSIRTAAWKDVRAKAMRLKREGAVHVKVAAPNRIKAVVDGDTGIYDVLVIKEGNSNSISQWYCGCAWGRWAFKRKRSFVGRLCSHAYASYLSMGQQPGGSVSSTKRQRTYPYYTGEPTPSGHLTLKRKRRRSSLLDEYKSWAKDENSGNIDIPSADDFLSQRDEIPTPTEAKAVYDYACENASERPTRSYDVDGYSFDPGDHWDSTKTADDNALLRSEAPPFRLTPDLYLVPDGEGQHFTDVESDDRKTTGPDQITAKVDKSWAKKQHDLDDDHDPIVRFSARRMALTYTADENLLNRLRDLSAETNAENAGHMREHNQEISEVIGELHERGYDANRLVASIRTADEGDWERTQDGGRTLFRQPGNNDGWAMEGDTFSPIRWDGGGTQGPEGGRYNMPGSGNKDFTHTQDSKGRDLFRTRGPGGLLAENPQGFAVNPNGNIDNVNFVGSGELGDSNNRFDLADGDRPISENFKNFLKGNPGLDMPSGDPAKPSDPADPAGTNTNSGGGGGGGGGTNSGGGGGGGGTNSGGGGGGGSGWSENGNTDPIGPGEYKIQTGDTYSNLAERAGWGSDYQGFANATGYNADNPDMIYAGDTMNVVAPPGAGETTPPAPGADPAAAPVGAPPPPAPGAPAPADSTSGTPAPDPGVGGSTGFAPPVTPAAPAPTNDAIAAPGATLTGDQLTNPGLTMQSARHRLAWSDHSDTDLINLHRQNKHPGLRADVAQELWDRASGDIETYGYSDLAGYLEQHGINPPKNRIDRNASRQFWATDDDDKPKADYKSWYPRADSGDAGGGEDQNPAPKAQGPGLNGDYPTGETPPAAPTAAPTSPRGVKDPGPGPEQMTTPNFNQRPGPQEPVPSDGSKKLEEQAPQGQSTGGGGDFDMSQMMPILNGVGSAIGPLVGPAVTGLTQGITDGLGTIGSGIGSAIGSGLSGLLSFAAYDPRDDPGDDADPTFSGTGPERKYWYTTSEDWVDDHERDGLQDLNEEPTGDMITYRRQQPRQAANTGWTPEMIEAWAAKHDSRRQPPREEINFIRDDRGDNDIVARFQRSAANSAINASPGGTFSDDAIAHAARGFLRTAGRVYSVAEQQELMDESHPKGARNLAGLDLSNTHYEDLSWS